MDIYNAVAEEYKYDPQNYIGCSKLKDFHKKIVRIVAGERNWDYDEQDEETFLNPNTGILTKAECANEYCFENGEILFIVLYNKKERVSDLYAEAILFHWNRENSHCKVFVIPVYRPDTSKEDANLFEHSGVSWREDGMICKCIVRETFSDSYDLNDHGHYDICSGFVYDASKCELRYYDPTVLY